MTNRNPLSGTHFDDALDEKSETFAAPKADFDAAEFEDIFGDTAGTPGTDSLRRITDLVHQVQAHQASVAVWEQKIEKVTDDIKTLLEKTIPDAMAEVGMADIGLADGTRVKVEHFHRGSITQALKERAHAWLEDNGFGGLIKREVTVNFARDEEGVDGLRAYIRETGLACKEKETVHPNTLGAFIRDRAEAGETLPRDLFSIYSGSTTKLSQRK